jgi:tetratricopeptide (TPR) repeat protein
MSLNILMKVGIRVAEWATPHVKKWKQDRNLNFTEGTRHLQDGNWTEAERYLALASAETHGDSERRLEVLIGLAKAQSQQRKTAEAEQTVLRAVQMATKDGNRSGWAQAQETMADLQREQGKHAEAEQTLQQILQQEESRAGADQALLIRCYRKSGAAFLKTSRPAEALQALQQALLLSEQNFGPDHAETANALAELADLHQRHGNHPEAQAMVRRALDIHRLRVGKDSREAAMDLHILASSLEESGDFAGAMTTYEKVLTMSERQIGGNREAVAETRVRLAALYLHADRVPAARELLTHAVGTLERKGGEIAAIALEALAQVEEQSGRHEDAALLRDRASKVALKS